LGDGCIRVLPGQYFDAETGNHYNYFRDYDSSVGRYVESDPIGLGGGINTFAYSHANPIRRIDPQGMWSRADAVLLTHFYLGRGQYKDISGQCQDYLSDPIVQVYTNIMKRQVEMETQSRAGNPGSSSFSFSEKRSLYITSIYSFGSGNDHRQNVQCTFAGNGCCGTSTCKVTNSARDLFDDPRDLCEKHGICSDIRNLGGTPFWFGLSCETSFSVTACKK
jgi:RHS repeat-associated protein